MERLGLVGLANAGKTSLFNALTGMHAPVASHPFTTTETNVASAQIPDPRVDALSEMSKSKKTIYATVQVVDIAGLVAGASTGEGLGNRFLAGIREVDALGLVLRAFEDPEIPGESDPLAALETLELELVLADLATLDSQIEKRRKASKVDKSDRSLSELVEAMDAAKAALEEGVPLYRAAEKSLRPGGALCAVLGGQFLLTAKPVVVVLNVAEDQVGSSEALVSSIEQVIGDAGRVLSVAVSLEAEAAELDPSSRAELLEGLGLGTGALSRVAAAMAEATGREQFFTTGEKETRAWIFRKGSRAPQCAGVIHSDLERGFIRAEVIGCQELLQAGSWTAAKASGKVRLEGKDYVVQDGDVLEIRFNV